MSNKSQDAESKQPNSSFIQLDDAKQKGAASAASVPRRKALVGALTAVCIVLIVVSLGFIQPSSSGAWSIDWIVETVTGESVVAKDASVSGSTTVSGKVASKDSKSSDNAKDGSKGSKRIRRRRSPKARTARRPTTRLLDRAPNPPVDRVLLTALLRALARRPAVGLYPTVAAPLRAIRAARGSLATSR